MTHGDAHWWNFLYPIDATNQSVRVFDWQLWHVDSGPRDLAFLVALDGFAERRPEIERELVDHYYQCLISNGVRDYSYDVFWDDYRWGAVRNLNMPVIHWSQGRDETEWTSTLTRALASFEEL